MGGNAKAYRKTLYKVLEAEANTMERIQQSLNAGDRKTAVRTAHTLKGVSGNIGATSLQSAAADLEMALKDGGEEPSLKALMKLTEQKLFETLNTIKTALQTSEKAQKENVADMSDIKLIEVDIDEELESIVKYVEDYDSSAEEAVEALLEKVDDPKLRTSLDQLKHHLGAYDFDSAMAHLAKMLKR